MKAVRSFLSLFFAVLILISVGITTISAEAGSGKKIRVGYFEFSSFQDVDDHGHYSGYGYDYLQEISKYTDWEYEYVFASWNECLQMLEDGEIDLLGSAQRTQKREEIFEFPQLESGISYAVLCADENNTELAYDDFAQFDGIKIGIMKGNSRNDRLEEFCQENGFQVKTEQFQDQETLLNALHTGQVDAVLTSNLRKAEGERIVARFAPSPFYFVTTKGNQEILDELNYAQKQIKVTDPYFDTKLYDKYYSEDTQRSPVYTSKETEYIKNSPTLRVVYNPNGGPVEYEEEKTGRFRGITADLVQTISKSVGIEFEYISSDSFQKRLDMLRTGKVDLMLGIKQDYDWAEQNQITLTIPYITGSYSRVTNTAVTGVNAGVIAVMRGNTAVTKHLETAEPDAVIRYYETPADCFEALRKKEAGVCYINTNTATRMSSEYKYTKFSVATLRSIKDELCIALPKGADSRLLAVLNKSIQYLTDDEKHQAVISNTILSEKASLKDLIYQNPMKSLATCTAIFIFILSGIVYILIYKNKSRHKIYDLLYKDPLTRSWNFNKFRSEASDFIHSEKERRYALLYIDIKHFKHFNDTYGYSQGDILLIQLTKLFLESKNEEEMVARISNDNFIALLRYDSEIHMESRINYLNEQLNKIPRTEQESYKIILNTGVYVLSSNEEDFSVALDCASEAWKTAKASHINTCCFYTEQLRQDIMAERSIESMMDQSLEEGHFIPYFQPKFDLKTEKIVGAEALVRWKHPDRGLIPPAGFIPVFEKNGFVIEIDFYIFEEVCKVIRAWLDQGITPVPISSNFSRKHLSKKNFVERLKKISARYQVPAGLLELEITESAAEENSDLLVSMIEELKSIGFIIAMDDFGSGYSSLNLLKKLSVDTLKMDKEFLERGISSEKEHIIIEGFVHIAKKLKMQVVCEGIETRDQADFLRDIGCHTAQGYLFARPMPYEEFEGMVLEVQ